MKRNVVTAATLAAVLLLGACGSDTESDGDSGDSGDSASADLNLVTDGQLTVCSDMPYAPFESEEDGETVGFDVDIVSGIGDTLGLETEFVTTPFDSIIPSMVAGDCDLIASAMTITDERAEQVNFTEPYFDADQSLLVLTDNADEFASLEDLAGEKIGVQVETTGAAYAKENLPDGAEVIEFQTGEDIFSAMVAESVSAALQDLPVNGYRAAQDSDFTMTDTFPTGEQYGFAVSMDNEDLLDALNEGLASMRDDGSYDEIFAEWFGGTN